MLKTTDHRITVVKVSFCFHDSKTLKLHGGVTATDEVVPMKNIHTVICVPGGTCICPSRTDKPLLFQFLAWSINVHWCFWRGAVIPIGQLLSKAATPGIRVRQAAGNTHWWNCPYKIHLKKGARAFRYYSNPGSYSSDNRISFDSSTLKMQPFRPWKSQLTLMNSLKCITGMIQNSFKRHWSLFFPKDSKSRGNNS